MKMLKQLIGMCCAALAALCASAQVQNVNLVSASPTQAVIAFDVPDATHCTVQVFSDAARTQLMPDSDPNQFPAANQCGRTGNQVTGSHVVAVVGTRVAAKAANGRMTSRALQAVTQYYVTITDTAASASDKSLSFTTQNPPLGAMFPEPPPFDANGFGNYGWPELDWTKPAQGVIDPQTGFLTKVFTHVGAYEDIQNNEWGVPYSPSASQWSNLASVSSAGNTYATSNAAGPSDYLFVPLAAYRAAQGGPTISDWSSYWGMDDLLVKVYCSATTVNGTDNILNVALTRDSGQTIMSATKTVTCPAGTALAATIPASTPAPVFANWGLTTRPQKNYLMGTTGAATVAGSTVTWVGGSYFDSEILPGTKIQIAGSRSMSPTPCANDLCTVARVNSGTQITIQESCSPSGCPASAVYSLAGFGVKVWKATGNGSVNVSLGNVSYASSMSDLGVNGSSKLCSIAPTPITVKTDALGNSLGGPANWLQGRICLDNGGIWYLWISKNADGTPRGETRLLSLAITGNLNTNGFVHGPTHITAQWSSFDPVDPLTVYASYPTSSETYILKGTYNTSGREGDGVTPCDFRQWPSAGNAQNNGYGDCLVWTNITPTNVSPSMGMVAQTQRAYQTGLNALGATVGIPHPTHSDLSWLQISPYTTLDAGLMSLQMYTGQNGISYGLSVISTFDVTTGVLMNVTDTWSTYPTRWGGCHGCVGGAIGVYRNGANSDLTVGDPKPLNGQWTMPIVKVNRAGFGSSPNWDSNTALTAIESYPCPTGLAQALIDVGGSGSNCVQVKVSREPCSTAPYASATFPGGSIGTGFVSGNIEAVEYPCTTPGFGAPTGGSAWSKLQDVAVQDWVQDDNPNKSFLGGYEHLIVAQININSANDIDLWLIRWGGCRGARFQGFFRYSQDGGVTCQYGPPVEPTNGTYSSHANGWELFMIPAYSNGSDRGSQNSVYDPTNALSPWTVDAKPGGHGSWGASPTPGNYSFIAQDGSWYYPWFDVNYKNSIYTTDPFPLITGFPGFASSTSGTHVMQNYPSNMQFLAEGREKRWGLDYRHINPSSGNSAEVPANVGSSYTLQPAAGTNITFLLSVSGAQDTLSNGPPDIKRSPMVGVAGRFLLKDYSSPATGNVFGDAQAPGWCHAYAANECRSGSVAGNNFVAATNVSTAYTSCLSNQLSQNAPCVLSLGSGTAQIMQIDLSRGDKTGLHQRRLGYGLAGPLRQYEYDNARPLPNADYFVFPGNWVDGVRRAIMVAQLPPQPADDNIDRTTFVPVVVTLTAPQGAAFVRGRFGYAENGSPTQYYCTTRADSCSTDIPAANANDPYSFVSESPTRVSARPRSRSVVTFPAISGRVLYSVVDWLDAGGNVISSVVQSPVVVP